LEAGRFTQIRNISGVLVTDALAPEQEITTNRALGVDVRIADENTP